MEEKDIQPRIWKWTAIILIAIIAIYGAYKGCAYCRDRVDAYITEQIAVGVEESLDSILPAERDAAYYDGVKQGIYLANKRTITFIKELQSATSMAFDSSDSSLNVYNSTRLSNLNQGLDAMLTAFQADKFSIDEFESDIEVNSSELGMPYKEWVDDTFGTDTSKASSTSNEVYEALIAGAAAAKKGGAGSVKVTESQGQEILSGLEDFYAHIDEYNTPELNGTNGWEYNP